MNMPKLLKIFTIILLLTGIAAVGKGGYIHVKAMTAQILLKHAWHNTLSGGNQVRPWPWADTWPIARLIVPRHDIDQIILEGDTGNVLAFGPGRMLWSARPGQEGNTIISGHRDTNFHFLKDIETGDTLELEAKDGIKRVFLVENISVVKDNNISIELDTDQPTLTLVTCYPFDGIRASSQRLLVSARQKQET